FANYLTFNVTYVGDDVGVVDGPMVNVFVTTQIDTIGTRATVNFANRNHVTVNALGGDDLAVLNNPKPEAALADLTVNDSPNPSNPILVYVNATAADTLTTINASDPGDRIHVSPTAQNLDTIQGAVTVNGDGQASLDINDQAYKFFSINTI